MEGSPVYDYRFRFSGGVSDEQGNYVPDPPHVFITKDGNELLEVFEEPLPIEGTPILSDKGCGNPGHWRLGPEASHILEALRNYELVQARMKSLTRQLDAARNAVRRQHWDREDYVPYPDDERD